MCLHARDWQGLVERRRLQVMGGSIDASDAPHMAHSVSICCQMFVRLGACMPTPCLASADPTPCPSQIPSASMSLFNTLSVIVLVWVYDAVLEPALKKSKRFRMTLLRRQGAAADLASGQAGGLAGQGCVGLWG
jgi:hypothetical protein